MNPNKPKEPQTGPALTPSSPNDLVQGAPRLDASAVNDKTVLATADSSMPQPTGPKGPNESNTKKLIALLLAIGVVIALTVGLGFVFLDDGLEEYRFAGTDTSFGYPSDWIVDDGGDRVVDFTEPEETAGEYQAEISVALIDEEALRDIGIEPGDFFDEYKALYESAAAGDDTVELRSSEKTEISGREVLTISVGNSDTLDSGESGVETIYLVKLADAKYLGFGLEAHESDKNYAKTLKKMVESITNE